MDISRASVLLGEVTVPAGLEAGASFQFDQSFSLPPTPLAGVAAKQPVYISLRVDPTGKVAESDEVNNEGIAKGVDTSVVTIAQHTPANLIGTSLGIAPGSVTWGDAITVTAQVKNDAAGEAPATRARIVLTRGDVTPGGPDDVTIGNIAIPAVAPYQSVNVVETIRLPARPPALLAGGSQYILSMVQDADFLTNSVSPHKATQGRRPRHGGRDDRPRRGIHHGHDRRRRDDHHHDHDGRPRDPDHHGDPARPGRRDRVRSPRTASTGDTTSWPPPGSRTSGGSTPGPSASGSISPG